MPTKNINKDILYELYYIQKKSAREICKILNVSQPDTIYRYMDIYGFKRRNANEERSKKTMHGMNDAEFKKYLIEQYETKSINKIAEELGVSHVIIYKYMDKYGIPRLSQKESNAKFNANNQNNYKGGRISHGDGYMKLLRPEHPRANKFGYVLEHIVVMEEHIGRHLKKGEVVHHINGIKNDNRIENLLLLTAQEHSALHKGNGNLYKSVSQLKKEGV